MTATMALHLGLGSGSRGSTLSAKSRRTSITSAALVTLVTSIWRYIWACVGLRADLEQKTAGTSGRSAVGR